MIRWIALAILFAVVAAGSHMATLSYAPRVIMATAMDRLAANGVPLHAFAVNERMTPQTQTVVRPSPDLAYSLCRFDLKTIPDGLRVKMAATPDYASLSFFDADTHNFLTMRGDSKAREVLLLPPGSKRAPVDPPELVMAAPTAGGVVLIRQLAPDRKTFDAVRAMADDDFCKPA